MTAKQSAAAGRELYPGARSIRADPGSYSAGKTLGEVDQHRERTARPLQWLALVFLSQLALPSGFRTPTEATVGDVIDALPAAFEPVPSRGRLREPRLCGDRSPRLQGQLLRPLRRDPRACDVPVGRRRRAHP